MFEISALRRDALVPLVQNCQRYCASSARANSPLYRSAALSEAARLVFPKSCHTRYSEEISIRFAEFEQIRLNLVDHESGHADRLNLHDPLSFLVVNWGLSLFDGVCVPETNGYLDSDCMPGWDTWITIIRLGTDREEHGLLCWIPPELCRNVDSAVSIDAAQCMSWLAFEPGVDTPKLIGWGRRWG